MKDVEVVNGQGRALTAAEFYKLAEVPPEIEWFANLRNPNTRAMSLTAKKLKEIGAVGKVRG